MYLTRRLHISLGKQKIKSYYKYLLFSLHFFGFNENNFGKAFCCGCLIKREIQKEII